MDSGHGDDRAMRWCCAAPQSETYLHQKEGRYIKSGPVSTSRSSTYSDSSDRTVDIHIRINSYHKSILHL